MKKNTKEKEIIAQLSAGRQTWTELEQRLAMSTRTLSKALVRLMEEGKVCKYGIVEFGKIMDYYDVAKREEPKIALKVPKMFEKSTSLVFPLRLKENLDIEQALIEWFYQSLKTLMQFTRKILDIRYAEELSCKRRIEYTENWKDEAVGYASKWMDTFIEDVILHSDSSWREILGSYEDNPKALLQAMVKFSEEIEVFDETENKYEEKFKRRLNS